MKGNTIFSKKPILFTVGTSSTLLVLFDFGCHYKVHAGNLDAVMAWSKPIDNCGACTSLLHCSFITKRKQLRNNGCSQIYYNNIYLYSVSNVKVNICIASWIRRMHFNSRMLITRCQLLNKAKCIAEISSAFINAKLFILFTYEQDNEYTKQICLQTKCLIREK